MKFESEVSRMWATAVVSILTVFVCTAYAYNKGYDNAILDVQPVVENAVLQAESAMAAVNEARELLKGCVQR